ncbi:MAG: porin family protein [Dokdonella sp.]
MTKEFVIPSAALLCAMFALAPAVVHAEEGSFFVNGGLGRSSLNRFDGADDTGYRIGLGYRWAVGANALIGVEAGYTDLGTIGTIVETFIGPIGGTGLPTITSVRADLKEHGPTLGINARFNLTPQWFVAGRGGYMRAQFTTTPSNINLLGSSEDAWYAGAGIGYDVSRHFSIGINYDYSRSDTNGIRIAPTLVTLSGEYRF